jgi:heptaprenyl diphosphate synthase
VTPVAATPAQRGTPSVLDLPGATADLRERLGAGLAAVNALIEERVDHDDPFIAEAGAHLTAAGGKRFRPLLTLLTAELTHGINEQVVAAAAGVELTHLASLYHDDVMDEADVRRGRRAPTRPMATPRRSSSVTCCSERPPTSSPTSARMP